MFKKLTLTCAAAGALVLAGAGAASAGEITGNGKPVPAPQNAASECSYSGLNDDRVEDPARTQSFGQIVRLGGLKPKLFNPGDACNPNAAPMP